MPEQPVQTEIRRQYPLLDILKFAFAIVIIGIHSDVFADFKLLDMGFGVFSKLAVPMFFAISGFLFFQTQKHRLGKFIKRSGILYIIFSVFFFILSCIILNIAESADFIIITLTRGYRHLWFLYALMTGMAVLVLMDRFISKKQIITAISGILLFAGCFLNTYGPAANITSETDLFYMGVFRGIFEALPALTAGMLIARRKKVCRPQLAILGALICFGLFCAETLFVIKQLHVITTICWFFTVPCVYFILLLGTAESSIKNTLFFRKTATLIYLIHPAFVLCLAGIIPLGLQLFGIACAGSTALAAGVYFLSQKKHGHWLNYIL